MVASMPIEVVRVHVEGLESAQHHKADAAGRDGADMHALNVIGTLDAIGDVPTALHRFPASRARDGRGGIGRIRPILDREPRVSRALTPMTPAASPPKASPARGQPSSWGRRRIASSGRPRSPREPEVAAQLAIWGLSGCRAPDNPGPLDALAALELMFAGLRRRREAIRERETERDRLAEGWTPSRSPHEPQSSR